MRKAQLYGQIFIYVLTIVVISFIFILGYKAIDHFRQTAEQIACIKLGQELANTVDAVSSEFGRLQRKDIELCGDFTQVCFVESFEIPNSPNGIHRKITDSIASQSKKNVFLLSDLKGSFYNAKDTFYIGKISVEPDVICLKSVKGKVSLRFEGKGDHVILSEWS